MKITMTDVELAAVSGGKNVDVIGYAKAVGTLVVTSVVSFVSGLPGVSGGGATPSHDDLPRGGTGHGIVPL